MDRDSKNWMLTAGRILIGLVYAVIVSFVVILTTAFVLQLFGANPAADFANWVYQASERIMEPFRGIFPTRQISDRAVFNGSLLFAIIVYSAFALALHALIAWFTARLVALQRQQDRERYVDLVEETPTRPYAPQPPSPSQPAV